VSPLTVSVAEAAALLGVSDDLVYSCCHEGLLPTLQLGKRKVIPRQAIDQIIAQAMDGWSPDRALARLSGTTP
jgi:excisionase family DNA binding protein